jgi:hypothetical protein
MITLNINMPKDCDNCPFYSYNHDEADTCCITHENIMNVKSGEKHEKCPIIETNREKNNEHIQELIKIKENYESMWDMNSPEENFIRKGYNAICAGIEALKSEKPTGYWIREHHDELPKCSVCNLKGFGEYDYCHHCGAKMINASY